MEAEVKKLDPQQTNDQKCALEIDMILKQYNCTLICQQQNIYGQQVWVPVVAELKKQ